MIRCWKCGQFLSMEDRTKLVEAHVKDVGPFPQHAYLHRECYNDLVEAEIRRLELIRGKE